MPKLTIDVIAGARPNFMKLAALFAVRDLFPSLDLRFIHTGQHYDFNMSDVFLRDLSLPDPRIHLGVGSGTHAYQTAEIMKRYEEWILQFPPEICVVVGDVNSTIACGLAAKKCNVRLAHVEAGLRSFDRRMPEEINRVLTDTISDFLFITEPSAEVNLKKEGHDSRSIFYVGNTMIDTLLRMKPRAERLSQHQKFGLEVRRYAFLTLHRPSNVDDPRLLDEIMAQMVWVSQRLPVIFPCHPRTAKNLSAAVRGRPNLQIVEPLGYLESLSLTLDAKMVITDSGGLQEETTVLRVPCLTLRENTERPITLSQGTNTLINNDWTLFRRCVEQIMAGGYRQGAESIPLWDGSAGRRILSILEKAFVSS